MIEFTIRLTLPLSEKLKAESNIYWWEWLYLYIDYFKKIRQKVIKRWLKIKNKLIFLYQLFNFYFVKQFCKQNILITRMH